MKIAITGATGFIGSNLMGDLLAEGHAVVALCRKSNHPDLMPRHERLTWAPVGLFDQGGMTRALQGCEAVAHCAGIRLEQGRETFARVHEEATVKVVEASRAAGVARIALTSFLRARPACGSPYHESKWRAEEIVRHSGLEYVILKMGVVYGLGDHVLNHLSRALLTLPFLGLVGRTEPPVRPVAVEDVVRILKAALVDRRIRWRTLSVTGPEEMTLKEMVERIADAVEKKPRFVRLPVWMHDAIAWFGECLMSRPPASRAQIRMVSESLVEALPYASPLPEELRPRIRMTGEIIRRGLPDLKPFGLGDLRMNRRGVRLPCPLKTIP